MYESLKARIKLHEGCKLFIYTCTEGKKTIGYGHKLVGTEYDKFKDGITQETAEKLFDRDFSEAAEVTERVMGKTWARLPFVVKEVLIEMCFQMGLSRMLGFKKMLNALDRGEYLTAANEMIDSKWHKQTPNRVEFLAKIVRGAA